jgi:phage-related protein (TIGR01555 family)
MIFNLFKRKKGKKPAPVAIAPEKKRSGISAVTLAKSAHDEAPQREIERYIPPVGVIPVADRSSALAMDNTPYDYVNQVYVNNHFEGYQSLAVKATLPEYRKMVEVPAEEMTRKWIVIQSTGGDKTDKIKTIEDELKRHKVKTLFRKAAELDGFYGRGQIYIDIKTPGGTVASEDPAELQTALLINPAKIKQGSLRGFTLIEPVWTYPSDYNSTDPLSPSYYRPNAWYVLGKTVHHTRLMTFVSREVPDLLKASYNFGGLSMTQMAESYVNNWLRTRDSVSDLVHSYSTSGIKTNMSSMLNGLATADDEAQFFARSQLFSNLKDNRGLMLIDMDSEEFFQFNTPLSGLHELQAQAQEHMASVSSIPLVKLLGITPSGLNASASDEIQVFYDSIHSRQENLFRDPLTKVINLIQLDQFGEIDPEITFQFESLEDMDDMQKAQIRKTDADTDAVLVSIGAIAPDESRARVASDPDSGYDGLTGEADIDDEEIESAMDAAHWITVHGGEDPETGEHTGKRVMIDGSGKVIGGAGGKLNGKTFSNVKSKSKDIEKESKPGPKKEPEKPKESVMSNAQYEEKERSRYQSERYNGLTRGLSEKEITAHWKNQENIARERAAKAKERMQLLKSRGEKVAAIKAESDYKDALREANGHKERAKKPKNA